MKAEALNFHGRPLAQARELLEAIDAAESVIVSTIERECEALRSGRMLAAKALHTRLCDAARLYLDATRAAHASLWTMEQILPGSRDLIEERRIAFSDLLKVELAVLAAERAAIEDRSGGATDMRAGTGQAEGGDRRSAVQDRRHASNRQGPGWNAQASPRRGAR